MIHRLENSVFYDPPHYLIISTSLHRIGWYKYLNVKDQIVKQELYISLSVCGAFVIGNMQISLWCVLWLLKNSREVGCQMPWLINEVCCDQLLKHAWHHRCKFRFIHRAPARQKNEVFMLIMEESDQNKTY